jgi:hypothetical protein
MASAHPDRGDAQVDHSSGDTLQELLERCDDELGSPADAAVLRTQFARLVQPADITELLDEAVDCSAFALGAYDAARAAGNSWPLDTVLTVGELLALLGNAVEAVEVADSCYARAPHATRVISLWAQLAPTPAAVVGRFLVALTGADDPQAVYRAAIHYVEHCSDPSAKGQWYAACAEPPN